MKRLQRVCLKYPFEFPRYRYGCASTRSPFIREMIRREKLAGLCVAPHGSVLLSDGVADGRFYFSSVFLFCICIISAFSAFGGGIKEIKEKAELEENLGCAGEECGGGGS